MIAEALQQAGFPNVEPEGEMVHARLEPSGIEFRAEPEGEAWRLMLHWPMRAPERHLAAWNAGKTEALMDIHKGETRLSMLTTGDKAELARWSLWAEEGIAAMVRWRREQRQPGEGY